MDLFEYQARDLFEKYQVPVLQGLIADTPEQAEAAAAKIGGTVVVKAQVKPVVEAKLAESRSLTHLQKLKKQHPRSSDWISRDTLSSAS